jgi:hypothetical protein
VNEIPFINVIFIQVGKSSRTFDVNSVTSIPMNSIASALVNAIYDAAGGGEPVAHAFAYLPLFLFLNVYNVIEWW